MFAPLQKQVDVMYRLLFLLSLFCSLVSCNTNGVKSQEAADTLSYANAPVAEKRVRVARKDTCSLILLFPQFKSVDLVCETMPSQDDEKVIFVAEAAFTGELLKEFKHTNIAGDHVSSGSRIKGYKCPRNTGAFVYHNGTWKFLYQSYDEALDEAAANGGCGFGQEMIIHQGELVTAIRKDYSKNVFRALCEVDGKLCIAESSLVENYVDFKNSLMKVGASEALYLDMGAGWNHAWYRDDVGEVVELHKKSHNYCTNWITFYE